MKSKNQEPTASRMAQCEPGVLLVQNDVLPDAEIEFHAWLQQEHLPRHLALPGFRRARRYRAVEAQPAFMTVFDCDGIGALASKAYRQHMAEPSEWTRQLAPALRNAVHMASRETWSIGQGTSGGAVLMHCRPVSGRDDDARAFIKEVFAPPLMNNHHVTRIALWESDTSLLECNAAPAARALASTTARWVLFIETLDLSQTMLALHSHVLHCSGAHTGLLISTWTKYQLLFSCEAKEWQDKGRVDRLASVAA